MLCERLALIATEARAANELVKYAERLASEGRGGGDALTDDQALAYAADVVSRLLAIDAAHPDDFADAPPVGDDVRALVRDGLDDAPIRNIGARVIESRGANASELFR